MSIKKTATLLILSLILLSGSAGAAASAPSAGTGIGMGSEDVSASGIAGAAIPSGFLPGVFPGVGPAIGGQAGGSPAISGSGTSLPVDEIPSAEMKESFLNGKALPKTMKYQPLSKDSPSLGTYGGLLTVKGKSYTLVRWRQVPFSRDRNRMLTLAACSCPAAIPGRQVKKCLPLI